MSPTLTGLRTASAPAMVPLQDGPFSTLVTSLSGPDRRPLTMCPPVIIVPAPEMIR